MITQQVRSEIVEQVKNKVRSEMTDQVKNEVRSEMIEQVKNEVRSEIAEQIRKDVTQQLLQQLAQPVEVTNPPVEVDPNIGRSGMGSCVSPSDIPSPLIPPADIPAPSFSLADIPARSPPTRVNDRRELYVDDRSSTRLVSLGTVHEEGSTLHGVPLSKDLVRVVVEDIRDGDAIVPVPSEEVITVRQALGGFIAWTKYLVKPMSTQDTERPTKQGRTVDNPVHELLTISACLYKRPFWISCDESIFGFQNDIPVIIHYQKVLDVVQGKTCLQISTVQHWILFLKSLVVENRPDAVYGFFEPLSLQNIGSKKHASTLVPSILKHMQEYRKQIYLGAYHHKPH